MGFTLPGGGYYLSAYGIAVKHGFVGTEEDWLNSLAEDATKLATSYAVGGTDSRTGEDTDNAKYYKEQAEAAAETAAEDATEAAIKDAEAALEEYVSSASASAATAASNASEAVSARDTLVQEITEKAETAVVIDATLSTPGAAAEAVACGELKEDLISYNCANLWANSNAVNSTRNGITYTFDSLKKVCTITGTASADSFCNLVESLPSWMADGETYIFRISSTNSNIRLRIYFFDSSGSQLSLKSMNSTSYITVPDGTANIIVRINIDKGVSMASLGDTFSVNVTKVKSNYELNEEIEKRIYSKSSNKYGSEGTITLSDIKEDGFYVIDEKWTVTDAPSGLKVTALTVENFSTDHNGIFIKQIAESCVSTGKKRYVRFSNSSGTFSDWETLAGTNITNNYNYPEYNNTYNVTASPTFKTDTNNFLASTNDTTDRTADIVAMLSTTHVCNLGAGIFYIKELTIPNYSILSGCGEATKVYLIADNDTYAIKLSNYCTVENMALIGSTSDITVSDSITNRHGILFQGDSTTAGSPKLCTLRGLRISSFTGGGITLYNTGYSSYCCMNASDCYIENCNVGINISYWSEFNRFSMISACRNYYGCVNNGGNNTFTNCNFSNNTCGMLMDNSQSQSPNNSHGSIIGCVFNHSNENTGYGLRALGCANGEIITGCQFFYSQIYLDDCYGFEISNCNFGSTNCNLTISSGGLTLFSSNVHQEAPTITITDNTMVHFVNCYERTNGTVVSN